MIKLTVAIITFNEERNIARCLDSVKEIADEILVVDSFSTDKTEFICNQYQVRFVKNPFKGHIEQKNFALELSTHDYVLSLDADEALSPELLEEIKKVKENVLYDGYEFHRLTNYNGHWVRHCGWYPDTKLRLVKKSKAEWRGLNPHDILEMKENEKVGLLKGDLLHYSYESIASHVTQTDKFTTIAARAAFNQGKRSSLFKIFTRPLLKFFRDYFIKLGFLDGRYGFIICSINALSAMLKYSKLYDLQIGKKI
ncbi:MAG: glycosyltransferase family 2 protein [Bacteriovorax sp.]